MSKFADYTQSSDPFGDLDGLLNRDAINSIVLHTEELKPELEPEPKPNSVNDDDIMKKIIRYIFASSPRRVPSFVAEISFEHKRMIMERNNFLLHLNLECRNILKSTQIMYPSRFFVVNIMRIIINGCNEVAQMIQTMYAKMNFEHILNLRFDNAYHVMLSNISQAVSSNIRESVLTFGQFFQDTISNLPTFFTQAQNLALTDDVMNQYIRAIVRKFVTKCAFCDFMNLETENNTNIQLLEYYRTVAKRQIINDINVFIREQRELYDFLYGNIYSLCSHINNFGEYIGCNVVTYNIINQFRQRCANILNLLSLISHHCKITLLKFSIP